MSNRLLHIGSDNRSKGNGDWIMAKELVLLWLLLFSAAPATAQVSVGVQFADVSIGINLPLYPELEPVPGYPVYYAPRLDSNYFFYDGMYWVFQDDNWYASAWYNGPWRLVAPEDVPLYVLRVPVRYYRHPPAYFHGWRSNAPPRWGEHWGNAWEQRRSGWDHWNRNAAPAPAPLPAYQRKYSGDRYPVIEQQQVLQSKNYRYQPHDPVVRQHYQAPPVPSASVAAPRVPQAVPQERNVGPRQDRQHSSPPASLQQSAPPVSHAQPPQRGGENVQRSAPPQPPPQRPVEAAPRSAPTPAAPIKAAPPVERQSQSPPQGAAQHRQPEPRPHAQEAGPQGEGAPRESMRGQGPGQERDRERGDDRGQDHRR
jgi:hypothetical protein